MINMIYMGLNLNDYVVERGKEKETKTIDVVNSGPALLKHEKESDLKYDAWVSSVKDQNKLSKTEFSSGGTNVDARKLRLNEAEKKELLEYQRRLAFQELQCIDFTHCPCHLVLLIVWGRLLPK